MSKWSLNPWNLCKKNVGVFLTSHFLETGMNYKEFEKMRIPQIEEQTKKMDEEQHRWLYHSKMHVDWNWRIGRFTEAHPNDPVIDKIFFLPTFIAVWKKILNYNAKCFDVRKIDHTFVVEVKFLRYYLYVWAWTFYK